MNLIKKTISFLFRRFIQKDFYLVNNLLGPINLMQGFTHDYRYLNNTSVERTAFIFEKCRGKRVLHFGFLDSPFFGEKMKNNGLLHLQIKNVSSYLYGIDVVESDLFEYRKILNDFENDLFNIEVQNPEENDLFKNNFDVILFPEVLEHIPNPGNVCINLKKLSVMNNNCSVIFTVPNAFNYWCFKTALNGWEFQHPEHFHYYSPLTISNLLKYAGFTNIEIVLHSAEKNPEPGITKFGLIIIAS